MIEIYQQEGHLVLAGIKSSLQEQEAAASVPCPAELPLPLLPWTQMLRLSCSLSRIDLFPLHSVLWMLRMHLYRWSLTSAPRSCVISEGLANALAHSRFCAITDSSVELPRYQNNKSQLARWHFGGIQFPLCGFLSLCFMCNIFSLPLFGRLVQQEKEVGVKRKNSIWFGADLELLRKIPDRGTEDQSFLKV